MIYETYPLKLDIEKLRSHLEKVVFPLPITMQTKHFGGWSVLSATGHYKDGWKAGAFYKEVNGRAIFDEERARQAGWVPDDLHNKPTEICTGYLAEVMKKLDDFGFELHRARISVLKAGGAFVLHRDAPPENHQVRLHIPIVTNSACLFICEAGSVHLPADGNAYLIRVNQMHDIINNSDQDRCHLMMNVKDLKDKARWYV